MVAKVANNSHLSKGLAGKIFCLGARNVKFSHFVCKIFGG